MKPLRELGYRELDKTTSRDKWIDWAGVTASQIRRFADSANMFQPVYEELAKQIIEDYSTREGIALDIGSGTGGLAIELAKISNLKIYAVDVKEDMIETMKGNIKENGLGERILPVLSDVHHLPFDESSTDLIVSRGAFLFWRNISKAFREIHRILRYGGTALVGGGLGRDKRIREKVRKERERILKEIDYNSSQNENIWNRRRYAKKELKKALESAKIQSFRIVSDESGMWVEIKKRRSWR